MAPSHLDHRYWGKTVTHELGDNAGPVSDRSGADPVSVWIEQLAEADSDAAQALWRHFCSRLTAFARSRLKASTRRVYDEDDAALSAFRSLCRGIESQRFPQITDRDNLWALLVVIASRKITNRHRYDGQQRRNAERTCSGPLALESANATGDVIGSLLSREPTPEFAAEVADLSEHLLTILPDRDLRQIVLAKLEGHTNEEVAEMMGVTRRTVQRKLEVIRRSWLEFMSPKTEGR